MSPSDFSKLTPEHQYLLQLAKEQHGLEVIPLQELKGGQTGAFLYLASVSARNARQVQHFIIKFDHINEKAKPGETERHRLAASQAPSGFSKQNMPVLAYEFEHEGATALFYTLAGQSLQRFRTLASQERQNRLEALFAATNDYLLREWNNGSTFERALHPQKLLQMWLGYRLKPDGQVASFLRDKFRIDPHTEGFLIQGQVFPNPLSYGLDAERWKETRPIDVLTGFQHGDLNTGNILAKFAEDSKDLEGYFLIDFALYKDQMPLLYDQCYLEMSYLILELDHAPFQKWVSFVNHISVRDMPDPKEVPVELSGTCAVINAGRKSFERWMLETHPSLSDDLWGQFWLAGVAAGLNFCNKVGLSTEARLAGLIYSTAQLKRYCIQFGIPLPSDVCLLYDASKWVEMAPINKFTSASYIHHNNLPLQPTPFIGREAELSTLTNFLSDPKVRLVTIVGPGGMGKTRLALATAKRMLDGIQFPDGVFFVNLAPLSESNQIGSVVAEALNFRLQGEDGRSSQEKILDYLQDKQLLLLFDNCEHILDGMDLVAGILRAAPEVKILATSRERLQLRAEQVYLLEGLEFPDWETPEDAADYTAVRLFLQSARRNQPKFALQDRDDLTYLARICRLVAGMPLAVELAAAWVDILPLAEIAADLQKGLDFLETDMRDMPERHRSIRVTINHSWDRLDEKEQDIFSKLSVFRGGFTREAALAVAGADLHRLGRLVNKSFLQYVPPADRYQVHELMRQYGAEKLADTVSVRTQHLQFFAAFAEKADAATFGPEPEIWVKRLLADMDNFRTAMDWAVESDQAQAGMYLGGSLHSYWISLGDWREGRQRLERLLALPSAAGRTHARAMALLEAGNLASNMGEYETGLAFYQEGRAISLKLGEPGKLLLAWILLELAEHLASRDTTAFQQLNEEGLALLREVGEPWQIWLGLHQQGWTATSHGKFDQARVAFSEELAFVQKIGSRWLSGISLGALGGLLYIQDDYGAARPHLEESVDILRPLGDLRHQPLGALGAIAVLQGDYQQAVAYFEERLANHRRQGSKVYNVRDLSDLGIATAYSGDFTQAAALFHEALLLAQESNNTYDAAVCLLGVAGIQRSPHRMGRLLGTAQARFEQSGEIVEPLYNAELARIEEVVRAALGEDVFAAVYKEGKKMTLDEAVTLALNEQ